MTVEEYNACVDTVILFLLLAWFYYDVRVRGPHP
jgi:hypothetical protein